MRALNATHRPQRGFVLIAGLFIVMLIGGLALGLLGEGLAARGYVGLHERNLKALEMAETGIVQAEAEIRSQKDLGTAGIGNVQGDIEAGLFTVVVYDDPVSEDRWVLRSTGLHGLSQRRIEVGVRRRQNAMYVEALFAIEDLTLSNTTTDAYDSRLGTYASQFGASDGGGSYADTGGSVGSNGDVYLDGSSVWVRGNAIPGPFGEAHLSGSPTVLGDVVPREFEFPRDPTPYAKFAAAMQTNDNGSISAAGNGNTVRYRPQTYSLDIAGNTHAVLPGGTYFFKDVFVRGGSTLEFTGPTKIYVTGSFEIAAGTNLLAPSPADCRIYAHPYALPGPASSTCEVKVNGGSEVTWAMYAPDAELTIGGGNHFYGAAVARTIDLDGTNAFHYDKALGAVGKLGVAYLERLYWREMNPPRR